MQYRDIYWPGENCHRAWLHLASNWPSSRFKQYSECSCRTLFSAQTCVDVRLNACVLSLPSCELHQCDVLVHVKYQWREYTKWTCQGWTGGGGLWYRFWGTWGHVSALSTLFCFMGERWNELKPLKRKGCNLFSSGNPWEKECEEGWIAILETNCVVQRSTSIWWILDFIQWKWGRF